MVVGLLGERAWKVGCCIVRHEVGPTLLRILRAVRGCCVVVVVAQRLFERHRTRTSYTFGTIRFIFSLSLPLRFLLRLLPLVDCIISIWFISFFLHLNRETQTAF